jgi:hypothetical protein
VDEFPEGLAFLIVVADEEAAFFDCVSAEHRHPDGELGTLIER